MEPASSDDPPEQDAGFISIAFECGICAYRLHGSGSGPAEFCAGCGAALQPAATPAEVTGTAPILIAEDSSSLRRLVCSIVQAFGFDTVEARDGVEALTLMSGFVPHLVITDYHMPKMTGMALLQNMRKDPRLTGVGVVMLSRESGGAIIRQAKTLGVLDFIHKDDFYDPADLKARLSRLLQQES